MTENPGPNAARYRRQARIVIIITRIITLTILFSLVLIIIYKLRR